MFTIPCKVFLLALASSLLLMTSPGMAMAKSKNFTTFSKDVASTVVKRVKREFECELMTFNHRFVIDVWKDEVRRIGADFFDKLYSNCYWKAKPLHPKFLVFKHFAGTKFVQPSGVKKRAYTDQHSLTARTKRKWECELFDDDIHLLATNVVEEIFKECYSRDFLMRARKQLGLIKDQIQELTVDSKRGSFSRRILQQWLQQLSDQRDIISREKNESSDAGINRPWLDLVLHNLDDVLFNFSMGYVNTTDYRTLETVNYSLDKAIQGIQHELTTMQQHFYQEAKITTPREMSNQLRSEDFNERERLISLQVPLRILTEQIFERAENPTIGLPNRRMMNDWRWQMTNTRTLINDIIITREFVGIYRPKLDNVIHTLNKALSLLNESTVMIREMLPLPHKSNLSSIVTPSNLSSIVTPRVLQNLKNITVYLQLVRRFIQEELTSMEQDSFQGAEAPIITSSGRPTSSQILMDVKENLRIFTLRRVYHTVNGGDNFTSNSKTMEDLRQILRREHEVINHQIITRQDFGIKRPLLGNASDFFDEALKDINIGIEYMKLYPDRINEYRLHLNLTEGPVRRIQGVIDEELSRMAQDSYQEVEFTTWAYKIPKNLTEWDKVNSLLGPMTVVRNQAREDLDDDTAPNRGMLMDWRRQIRIAMVTLRDVINAKEPGYGRFLRTSLQNLVKAIPLLYSSRKYLTELSMGRDLDYTFYSDDLWIFLHRMGVVTKNLKLALARMDEMNRINLKLVTVTLRDLKLEIRERRRHLTSSESDRRLLEYWRTKLRISGEIVSEVRNKRKGTLDSYSLDTAHMALDLAIRQLNSTLNHFHQIKVRRSGKLRDYKNNIWRTRWWIIFAKYWTREQLRIMERNENNSPNSQTEGRNERPTDNPDDSNSSPIVTPRNKLKGLRRPLQVLKQRIQKTSRNRTLGPPTRKMLKYWTEQLTTGWRKIEIIRRTIDRPNLRTASYMLITAVVPIYEVLVIFRRLRQGVDPNTTGYRDNLMVSVKMVQSALHVIRQEIASMGQA